MPPAPGTSASGCRECPPPIRGGPSPPPRAFWKGSDGDGPLPASCGRGLGRQRRSSAGVVAAEPAEVGTSRLLARRLTAHLECHAARPSALFGGEVAAWALLSGPPSRGPPGLPSRGPPVTGRFTGRGRGLGTLGLLRWTEQQVRCDHLGESLQGGSRWQRRGLLQSFRGPRACERGPVVPAQGAPGKSAAVPLCYGHRPSCQMCSPTAVLPSACATGKQHQQA